LLIRSKASPNRTRIATVPNPLVSDISESKITSTMLRCLAAALLVVYLAWNLFWLSQRAIPPSLFAAMTGLPCPTTGGTRAFCCLLEGDVRESLRFNAMTIPLLAMLFATLAAAACRHRPGRAVSLPPWFVSVWLGLLLVAWVMKLASPPSYW
jgi:hypothetical protein